MPKFCSQCGAPVGEEAKFCPRCGYNLKPQEKPAEPQDKVGKRPIKAEQGPTGGGAPTEPPQTATVAFILLAFVIVGLVYIYSHHTYEDMFKSWITGGRLPITPTPTATPPSTITIRGTVAVPAAAAGGVRGTVFTGDVLPSVVLIAGGGSPSGRRTAPRCDPGPCRRIPNAPVGIVRPTQSGWRAEPVSGTTDSNGDFSITVDENLLMNNGPVFIAASPGGASTLMSTIPADLVVTGATIELAVDRTTTAAAVMHCPGGVYPPPRGGFCWRDPKESTNIETLHAKIDLFFANNPSTTIDLDVYLPGLLNDPDVLNALNQILGANGLAPVSAQDITKGVAGLPAIEPATPPPPTTTPRPTPSPIPTRHPSWTAGPPTPPTPSPPNLPSGFPTNVPSGTYSITVRSCSPAGCYSSNSAGSLVNEDIGTFANEIVGALGQAAGQCPSGVSCRLSFSPFDGRSFTATYSITACYKGQCATSNTDFVVSRVS